MPDDISPLTILIADDEELARAGIRTLLSRAEEMYHTTNLFSKNRQEAAFWALKYLPDNPDISPG